MRLILVKSDSNGLLKISSSRIHLVIITFTQFENRFGGRIKILIWFEGNTLKCSKTDVPNNNEYMNRGREIKIEPNRPNHTKLLWWYFAWKKILVECSIRGRIRSFFQTVYFELIRWKLYVPLWERFYRVEVEETYKQYMNHILIMQEYHNRLLHFEHFIIHALWIIVYDS